MATPDSLTIPQVPNGPFTLEIETLVDPTANTQLSGLYRSSGTYCTQCEAEGFRRITYFPDRPDVMAVYTTRIEADKSEAPVLLSNGNLIDSGDLPGGRHFAIWHDPHPKPSYLFALVGGNLGARRGSLPHHVRARRRRCASMSSPARRTAAATPWTRSSASMRWDEEAFGREYDLDIFMIVAVSDFNMGAMENKGLNVFNDKYVLASADTATDGDFASIEAVIAHEYFHNWTGNRITCRDWFQLCLKEGLTVFRDQEFSSDMRSRPVKRIADVRGLRAAQFIEDAGPLAHPVRPETYKEINNFYTSTVYEKGAEVVRMVQTLIGRGKIPRRHGSLFRAPRRPRRDRRAIHPVLRRRVSGRDMTQFMRWYSQAGTPEVTVAGRFDAARKTYTLEAQAKRAADARPADQGADGDPARRSAWSARTAAICRSRCRTAHDRARRAGAERAGARRSNSPASPSARCCRSIAASRRRSSSSPISTATISPSSPRTTAMRSTAGRRCRRISMRLLIDNVAALRAGKPPRSDDKLIAALAAILDDASAGAGLRRARAGAAGRRRHRARDRPRHRSGCHLPRAHGAARRRSATGSAPALAKIYERMTVPGPYSPDAASAGRRSLRNVALDLLAATGAPEAIARAARQYDAADNMTDRMAALATLVAARRCRSASARSPISTRATPPMRW